MRYLLAVIALVLPFSHFLLTRLNIWQTQGYFFELAVLALYSFHIFKKSKPLGVFLFWAGLVTAYYWIHTHITKGAYSPMLLFPFFNLLLGVILFDIITSLTEKNLEIVAKIITYTVYGIIGYCVLQVCGLDQFYRSIDIGVFARNHIVGTIGNQMHLAHYLAITLPFILARNNKTFVVLAIIIIALTNTTSGLLAAVIALLFYTYVWEIMTRREWMMLVFFLLLVFVFKYHTVGNFFKDFFSDNGRVYMWKQIYPVFSQRPITGWGLGFMNSLGSLKGTFYGWRYMHNELYQVAMELGVIGAGIVVWGIVDYFMKFVKNPSKLSVATGASFLAFIVCSFFGFPAHLWIISFIAIFAYSFQYLEEYSLCEPE